MSEKQRPINEIVADNLAHWMGESKLNQTALAERAGVSQKTVSNYLNPEQRAESSSGKAPSAKLSELERIAAALHIQVWQLTRGLTASERGMYEAIEAAYQGLRASISPKPDDLPAAMADTLQQVYAESSKAKGPGKIKGR